MAQRADTCYACGAPLAGSRRHWRLALPWADFVLFAVIAGLVGLWWTHPLATASVRLPTTTATAPTPTPAPEVAGLWQPDITPEPTSTPTPPASATLIPPSASATPIPAPKQHKVAAGESVGLIAEKYGITTKDLLTFNNLSSNFIVPGQMLNIPGSALPATATPVPTPTGGTLIYKVQAGDTIAGLAAKYGADLSVMLEANKMRNGDILQVGQVILIPLGGAIPSPTPTVTPTAAPPTFTPGVAQRAPALLLPAENGLVEDASPLLGWTSIGLLADDEWYVVLLRPAGADRPLTPYWTKITSWRVPVDYRVPGDSAVSYTWQVQVVKGRPDQTPPAPVPLGPASPPRHFVWY